MINTTKAELVFIKTGEKLHACIVSAFSDASKWVLQAYGLQDIDLSTVTTKNHHEAALPAHIEQFILADKTDFFDEDYLKSVFAFVSAGPGDCSPSLYVKITRSSLVPGSRKVGYRKAYLPPLRRGFSVFLIALHIRRAIVLPFSFQWPWALELGHKGSVIGKRELCPLEHLPELLRFVRSLDYREGAQQSEQVFNAYNSKQRGRLVWLSQRLIIAAGWLEPSDVSYQDMLDLWIANDEEQFSGHRDIGMLMLADLFERKYGDASPVNAAGWRRALASAKPTRMLGRIERARGDSGNLMEQAAALSPVAMAPENLVELRALPGLEFDLKANSEVWIGIERTFLRKVRHEYKKHRIASLGYLNIYLFGYLSYWYAENPGFKFAFPSEPAKLISAVFVSELGLLDGQLRPLSFVEFLESVARARTWEPTTHYAVLKQVEQLFDFIERYSDSLPGSKDFRQPLRTHDYPAQTKSTGTNKRPIPRRVFKLHLSYVEALAALSTVLLERVVEGELCDDDLIGFDANRTTIDCFKRQNIFGFVPVVFHQGKVYPLWRIPNVFFAEVRSLKGGRTAKVPHPHSLHQILVALYTGLRHNHIQWLDNEAFDQHVDDAHGSREYAELYVNTDKAKSKPWTAFVNFRVIEILRQQRTWRTLIDEPGFKNRVYYNNNPESKWGCFLALFAHFPDGRPHTDATYSSCWSRLLGGLQSLLGTVGEGSIRLVRLLPRGVAYGDPEMLEKLHEYGGRQTRLCEVSIKSDITPHSARVSVVSHAIGILPADLIGRYWTGQTEAAVYHYVVPDEEETYAEQQRQNIALRQTGYDKGYESMLRATQGKKSPYIKADEVNSNLSKSLKTDFDEAITAYGCISLSFAEGSKTGLDVLRDTRAAGAVENKTEICPYGNQCPTEVLTQLKGWKRCGPCAFAVRSVDHLPAITAKIRQVLEGLSEIEMRIAEADNKDEITADEFDALEQTRDILAEDLAAWQMAAEVLEVMRQRFAAGESTKSWHVQKPEIIEKDLRRALFPTDTTEYVLARLQESEAFPLLESPQIRARFDLLRRQLLANTGNIREALKLEPSANPGAECLGLLRSIVAAHRITLYDLKEMLGSDSYLDSIPSRPLTLLPKGVA